MLELLGTLLGSIFSGGATGLIGVAIQRYADYKNQKLNFEHQVEIRKLDKEIMSEEWAYRAKVAAIEGEARVETEEAKAFAASFQTEPTRYSEGIRATKAQAWLMFILDFVRGWVRPGLTVYLCTLSTMIYIQTRELLGQEELSSTEALELTKLIISTVLYLTTTCVLWWFGTREKRKGPSVAP